MSKINTDNLIKQLNFKSNIYLSVIEAIVEVMTYKTLNFEH